MRAGGGVGDMCENVIVFADTVFEWELGGKGGRGKGERKRIKGSICTVT